MGIAQRLTEDMKTSMKASDADRTNVLRLLRGALKNEEIKVGQVLDEEQSIKVLQREAKQRRDSIQAYEGAGRPELAAKEKAELDVIASYLPESMGEEELLKVVDEVVSQLGASSSAQMGMVIGEVLKRVGARADGSTVSRLVRQKLAE